MQDLGHTVLANITLFLWTLDWKFNPLGGTVFLHLRWSNT